MVCWAAFLGSAWKGTPLKMAFDCRSVSPRERQPRPEGPPTRTSLGGFFFCFLCMKAMVCTVLVTRTDRTCRTVDLESSLVAASGLRVVAHTGLSHEGHLRFVASLATMQYLWNLHPHGNVTFSWPRI